MSINTQKSRERIKRSTLTGVVPTVPVSSDFTDGTWLNTDIRAGEFFYNIPDEKLWIGTNTVPLELTSGIANTLAQILTNGNTTGGSDIIITSGDLIRDSSSKAILGLDPSYTALYYKDTNATPNESILSYNPDNSVVGIGGEQYSVALINRRNVGGSTQFFNGLYIGNMTYDLKSPFLGLGLTGALLVTTNSLISAGVFNSAIIGGSGATINTSVSNSIILGGVGLTATASDSVYVPDLYIQSGKSIKSTNGGGRIDLDAYAQPNTVLITTVDTDESESVLYMDPTTMSLSTNGYVEKIDFSSGKIQQEADTINIKAIGAGIVSFPGTVGNLNLGAGAGDIYMASDIQMSSGKSINFDYNKLTTGIVSTTTIGTHSMATITMNNDTSVSIKGHANGYCASPNRNMGATFYASFLKYGGTIYQTGTTDNVTKDGYGDGTSATIDTDGTNIYIKFYAGSSISYDVKFAYDYIIS